MVGMNQGYLVMCPMNFVVWVCFITCHSLYNSKIPPFSYLPAISLNAKFLELHMVLEIKISLCFLFNKIHLQEMKII